MLAKYDALEIAARNLHGAAGPAHPEYKATFAELLHGEAWTHWCRAVDRAPCLIGHMPRGIVARSLADRTEATKRMADALEILRHRVVECREHNMTATHDRIRGEAEPLIIAAKYFLDMMPVA